MALAQDLKKGGPYTKQEKEERRKEVYKMHFEQGKSAIKISEILGVNRNTIGNDIRYWYSQISQEIWDNDFDSHVISIIHEYELQKSRLLDYLEKAQNFEDKMKIERHLSDINNRLGQLVTKLMARGKMISVNFDEEFHDIAEEEIQEFVRYLIFNLKKYIITGYGMIAEYIRKTGVNRHKAGLIIEKMFELDLLKYKIYDDTFSVTKEEHKYDIVEFASMREYITLGELAVVRKKYKNTVKFESY